jgi:hypothetical protein
MFKSSRPDQFTPIEKRYPLDTSFLFTPKFTPKVIHFSKSCKILRDNMVNVGARGARKMIFVRATMAKKSTATVTPEPAAVAGRSARSSLCPASNAPNLYRKFTIFDRLI